MTQNIELWPYVVMAIPLVLLMLAFIYAIRKGCCKKKTLPELLPEESQEVVWSISLPETSELPTYEELQANPENKRPPGYWTLFPYKMYYDQPVITETL